MKHFESFDSNKIEIGLSSNSSFDSYNFTASTDVPTQQSQIDAHFQNSATPAFVMMLSLSVATFIAAFFQVQNIFHTSFQVILITLRN